MSEVGAPGILFLVLFCLVLPYLVVRASRRQRAPGAKTPERARYFLAVLVNQLIFLVLALLVVHVEWIDVFDAGTVDAKALLFAAVVLVLAVASVPLRWRITPDDEKRRLLAARPAKATDLGLWLLVSLSAGVVEE